MITTDYLSSAMQAAFRAHEQRDGLCFTTHCIYPSGEFVRVTVYGRGDSFTVSDGGGAMREIESVGEFIDSPDKILRDFLKQFGVTSRNGVIRSKSVNREMLPFAVACVANAAKGAAEWLFASRKIPTTRNLKLLLRAYLDGSFPTKVHAGKIVGGSNKPHTFETILSISPDKRIIVDPVSRDSTAINSTVVANIDVQKARIPGLEQRIVYDDEDDWTAGELNILQLGAPVVPYSSLPSVLQRLAS